MKRGTNDTSILVLNFTSLLICPISSNAFGSIWFRRTSQIDLDTFSLMFSNFKSSMSYAEKRVTKVHCTSVIFTDQWLREKNSSMFRYLTELLVKTKSFRILLGLGISKPWQDILEEFAGVRTFSAQACLRYFQPLRDYLEELVEQGQLQVGWTCDKKNNSIRTELVHISYLLLLCLSLIVSKKFV